LCLKCKSSRYWRKVQTFKMQKRPQEWSTCRSIIYHTLFRIDNINIGRHQNIHICKILLMQQPSLIISQYWLLVMYEHLITIVTHVSYLSKKVFHMWYVLVKW
jgi:hypothetical protein